MMFKKVIIILTLAVCCYCLDKNETQQLTEEARAKKRKGSLRLLAIIAIAVIAKVVIAKVVTFIGFVAFFQKLFYLGGLLLNYFLRNQGQSLAPAPVPQVMYGPPQEYNTVGYSYDPPESELFQTEALPSIADFSGGLNNWLFNKHPQ